MFGMGMPELIIILVITMVLFGPAKIPQIGSALGGAIRSFRKATDEEPKQIKVEKERATETKVED